MVEYFKVHICTVVEDRDINTFLILLADAVDNTAHVLELQQSLEYDDQDIELGMDTYCVVTRSGATCYGGITSCVLAGNALTITFSKEAEALLGLQAYQLSLAISEADMHLLTTGLHRLFVDDRCAPHHLSLQVNR